MFHVFYRNPKILQLHQKNNDPKRRLKPKFHCKEWNFLLKLFRTVKSSFGLLIYYLYLEQHFSNDDNKLKRRTWCSEFSRCTLWKMFYDQLRKSSPCRSCITVRVFVTDLSNAGKRKKKKNRYTIAFFLRKNEWSRMELPSRKKHLYFLWFKKGKINAKIYQNEVLGFWLHKNKIALMESFSWIGRLHMVQNRHWPFSPPMCLFIWQRLNSFWIVQFLSHSIFLFGPSHPIIYIYTYIYSL